MIKSKKKTSSYDDQIETKRALQFQEMRDIINLMSVRDERDRFVQNFLPNASICRRCELFSQISDL